MINDLVEALTKKEVIFDRSQDAHARELKANQRVYWKSIGTTLIGNLSNYRTSSDALEELKVIFLLIDTHAESLTKIQKTPEAHVVVSSLPLITGDNAIYSCAHNVPFHTAAAIFAELSPLILQGAFGDENRRFTELGAGCFAALGALYVFEKCLSSREGPELLDKLKSNASSLLQGLEEKSVIYENATRDIEMAHLRLSSTFSADTDKALSKFERDAAAKVDAYLNAQRELDKIRRPVNLWSDNARKHRWSFRLGLVGLLATVGLSGFGLLVYLPDMLDSLGFIKSGSAEQFTPASTLTLAIFIALVAAAGFVLKIAGRFVTNALTLAEDAEVRSALADTFIGLTAEDSKATEATRDQARTVMLAALFRPLPGHQQEEITAPTVLSLAQDMLGKRSSS